MIACLLLFGMVAEPPTVVVDRDNVAIVESCRVEVASPTIHDADRNGIIQIIGNNLVVDLTGAHLRGSPDADAPDEYTGIGILVTGRNVTIRNGTLSRMKVAIRASGADGLLIDGVTLDDNFRQRLKSTPQAEDSSDWLSPHHNDNDEWLDRYGAGLWIGDSKGVTVRNVTARRGQNGIVLDHVTGAKVYDNDCSFLSGWGLAIWRASACTISRNAFDFCIRGYSHGVYNRGQDSAGILMFEQCTKNIIAENSVTHGGDGVFAFAGSEALGDVESPNEPQWHAKRGNTGNVFIGNDLSYAAAHGLELTFSFDNLIHGNRFVENAICGIWGGYSQSTDIAENEFIRNGDRGYGLERGGVNIEHGSRNLIQNNRFIENRCGVHLWWDNDEHLLNLPWTLQNGAKAEQNVIAGNTFEGDLVAVHLRETTDTQIFGNTFSDVGKRIDTENARPHRQQMPGGRTLMAVPAIEVHGDRTPVGARPMLAGRQHIIMTEWGPHDWTSPRYAAAVQSMDDSGRARVTYQYLPALLSERYQPPTTVYNYDTKNVEVAWVQVSEAEPGKKSLQFTALRSGVHPIQFEWGLDRNRMHDLSTVLVATTWSVRHFRSVADPREDYERWKRAGERAREQAVGSIDFRFGSSGPSETLGADHFGTIATTKLPMPRGQWRIETVSDDGIRVWIDDELVIDDWTWHAPTRHDHAFFVSNERQVSVRVEHFELDGHAELSVQLKPAD